MTAVFLLLMCSATSAILCYFLLKHTPPWFLDVAGSRSLHSGVIPRSGGLAILVSIITGFIFLDHYVEVLPDYRVIIAAGLLVMISLIDDLFSLSPRVRFLFQLLSALLIVFVSNLYFSVDVGLPEVVIKLVNVIGLVWMINLYNFMDGMDGFASGMALTGFGTLAALGYLHTDYDYVLMNLVIVASVAGFWCWNFPPAKIFMGDVGSTLLGFLAGVFALIGWSRGLFPIWVPAIVFSPFWVDASYTLLRRVLKGERFWEAHRNHIYQRLVLSGLGHRQVVMIEYLVMLLCSLSVLLPLWLGLGYNPPIIAVWVCAYVAGIYILERRLLKPQK